MRIYLPSFFYYPFGFV